MATAGSHYHIGTNDLGPYARPTGWPGGQVWVMKSGAVYVSSRSGPVAHISPTGTAFRSWLHSKGIHVDKVYRVLGQHVPDR